jgi:hypothetical protein
MFLAVLVNLRAANIRGSFWPLFVDVDPRELEGRDSMLQGSITVIGDCLE